MHARHLAALFAAVWLCGGASASMAGRAAASIDGVAAPHDQAVVSAAAPAPLLQPTLCGPALSAGGQRWLAPAPRVFDAALRDRLAGRLPGRLADGQTMDIPAGDASGVVTLPPGPGSASLVTAGLLCLGAFGGLRSLRKAHLGSLPEWYSTSGPKQIGHATPLDPDFPVFAIRAFETVDPAVTIFNVDPIEVDISPQLKRLERLSPRGPPLF